MAQNDSDSVKALEWVQSLVKLGRNPGLGMDDLIKAQREFKALSLDAKGDVFLFLLGSVTRQGNADT